LSKNHGKRSKKYGTLRGRPKRSLAENGRVRYGTVRYGTVRYGTVRYGTVRYAAVRYTMVRYGTVRYGVVDKIGLPAVILKKALARAVP
jgi:hypothetical protein